MSLLLIPRVSEKTYAAATGNVYVFDVPLSAVKAEIAKAVATQYGVEVVTVNIIVHKGKAVRASRGKRSYPGRALRSDTKKAYVRLAANNRIDGIFAEETK